jgi:hypothetical protein
LLELLSAEYLFLRGNQAEEAEQYVKCNARSKSNIFVEKSFAQYQWKTI